MKPLLVIFSPRDIPAFHESVKQIKEDKLWIRYYPQGYAYMIAKLEFLSHPEYTHMVILTDDLIVGQPDIDILKEDSKEFHVISGWMNVTNKPPYNVLSDISFSLPPDPTNLLTIEDYNFVPIEDLESIKKANIGSPTPPVINVKHQGTGLTFIPHRIVERVSLRAAANGCCPDLILSRELNTLGIKQYVDLRVRLLHLKEDDSGIVQGHPVMTWIKKPEMYWEKV